MDPNVSPCDNFYQFACGGFINTTVIPIDENHIAEEDILFEKIQQQLRVILEAKPLANETRHVRLVKTYYNSCMNHGK